MRGDCRVRSTTHVSHRYLSLLVSKQTACPDRMHVQKTISVRVFIVHAVALR